MEPDFFSHFLLDRQKDEYLCSFLEVVPRLAVRHLLRPMVILLRLIVVVVDDDDDDDDDVRRPLPQNSQHR